MYGYKPHEFIEKLKHDRKDLTQDNLENDEDTQQDQFIKN
jgi:hypothetical protein